MNKKVILILICFIALISCGKKADPKYKESKIPVNNLIIC